MRAIEVTHTRTNNIYIELFRTVKQFQSYLVAFSSRKYFSYYRFITRTKRKTLFASVQTKERKTNFHRKILACHLKRIWAAERNRFNCKLFFFLIQIRVQVLIPSPPNIWPINLLMLKITFFFIYSQINF